MKKNMMRLLAMALICSALVYLASCGSDDDKTPSGLTISSATANGVDINGSTAATGVNSSPSIAVNFNNDVNASTATNANITLKRDFDQADVPLTIVTSSKTVTITPTTQPLYGGALYVLSVGSGLKSTGGTSVTPFTRSFTTAGTFLPSGQIAHYGFESNANDDATGATTYNPAASDVVDLTYVDGRNAASGKAGSFNGLTTIVEIPNGPQIMNTADFTMSFWVKPNYNIHTINAKQDTSTNFVLGLGGYRGFEWEFAPKFQNAKMAASYDFVDKNESEDLWMDTEGKTAANGDWQGWTYSKDLRTSGGLAAIAANKWTNIVVVYNGTTKVGTIYVNNTKMKSQDFNLWPSDGDRPNAKGLKFQSTATGVGTKLALGFYADRSTTAFDFANYSDTRNHYNGLMDDLRFFHKALSEAELTLMYNSEKP